MLCMLKTEYNLDVAPVFTWASRRPRERVAHQSSHGVERARELGLDADVRGE